MDNTVPGFYPKSGSAVTFTAGTDQLSREYVQKKINFSILSPASMEIVSMAGIPSDAAVGSSFTLSYSSMSSLGSFNKTYEVTVVKEDGAMLWLLGSEGDKFIVKK